MKTVTIMFHKLDGLVRGLALREAEGEYLVAINTDIPPEQQKRTFGHELTHVLLNHCDICIEEAKRTGGSVGPAFINLMEKEARSAARAVFKHYQEVFSQAVRLAPEPFILHIP